MTECKMIYLELDAKKINNRRVQAGKLEIGDFNL